MKIYSYTHGTANNEQDFITVVDTFLLSTIGSWTRIEKVSDTASDRDYAWRSVGEDEARGNIFIRMRGYNNNIYNYGYGTYTSSVTNNHELYDVDNTFVPTNGVPFRYWLFGDKNFICYNILNFNDTKNYQGYLGFIRSYYVPETDRVPLLVHGQTGASYSWTATINQCYMHAVAASGEQLYAGYSYYTNYLVSDCSLRESSFTMIPIPLYCTNAVSGKEVRGEPYGVFAVSGYRASDVGHAVTASGVFLTFSNNNDRVNTFAYGPIAAYQSDFSDY